MRPADRRLWRLLAGGALALSLAGLAFGEPALERLSAMGPSGATGVCGFRASTGAPCLGCGGTHAFGQAARGRLTEAMHLNPLGAWAGLALWLTVPGSLLSIAVGRGRPLLAGLAAVAALTPVVFVWNAWAWWMSAPVQAALSR
jgi:hypothetical protein